MPDFTFIRKRPFVLAAVVLIAAAIVLGARIHEAEHPAREPELVFESMYNYVIIVRDGSIVRFRRMENSATLSAVDLANPMRQVIPYTRALFAASFVNKHPHEVLSIGLGAGAFNRLFGSAFPDAKLTTIEIDPMILRIAKDYAGFRETPRDKVMIDDGRRYAARSPLIWDWVVLDAFVRRSQVPFHLTTIDFYKLVSNHLSANGVLISNLLTNSRLFLSQLRSLMYSFPQVVVVDVPQTGNAIALAVKFKDLDLLQLIASADIQALPDLKQWDVDLAVIKNSVRKPTALSLADSVPILSDDFAPVEFLDLLPE